MSAWQYCALTDTGARRKHNEDSVMSAPELGLWAVADGMGGHEAGDVASGMIVDALASIKRPENFSLFVDAVELTLQKTNQALRDHSEKQYAGRTMGSTVVALLIADGYGACMWAGDSRLYRFRNNTLEQLSRDHSQVQRLVDAGLLAAEDADAHPNANVITKAVGGAVHLAVDVVMLDVQPGDRFLLCSDGLYNELNPDEIAVRFSVGAVEEVARQLLQGALEKGARDNVSVIVVEADV
ncbi:MAG: serine/threonine-protein phosphatase [Gammaproteobacteria bacterium]|nr:serine/threonine-protein phosphatase [Gammaproteobacteria bacterium]MBQ0775286.1 serine/threonine-protein phosphatase [Gammaproteobacteria bacterium]